MIEGEVTYDEFGNPVEGEDNAVGGLSMYSDPNVQKNMTNLEKLAKQQTDRYDALEKALAEKRYGPSFSERMFQLSAALATPTAQRGIGGVLANVTPVLQAQMQAKRQGELTRREALEKLDTERLEQQVGLAKQGLSTSLAMARLKNQRQPAEFGYQLDANGVVREIPKKVYRPKNEAEYAAIPIGQYYAVPSGPDAGKVLVKR
jgi:hypothetical protein